MVNKQSLVQEMAWRWTGDKPLPEPMLTQLTDTYMYVALGGDELSNEGIHGYYRALQWFYIYSSVDHAHIQLWS